jgi:hypothetical protein
MPKPGAPTGSRAGATPLRDALIARHEHDMERWRIQGHVYPCEEFLKSGCDVVVSSKRLARALAHAGEAADRFDYDGPDADKVWLLGADDRLTEIRDEHVAEMAQADFDELVEGIGPLRRRVGDVCDPHAAVERHGRGRRRSGPGSASGDRSTGRWRIALWVRGVGHVELYIARRDYRPSGRRY